MDFQALNKVTKKDCYLLPLILDLLDAPVKVAGSTKGMGGTLRQVSEVRERYVTQRGLVGTWTGLGFNLCVAPNLMFCPCISGRGTN